MLAVLAVLAVVVAVSMPVVTSLSKNSSRNAAVNLTLSALDHARALAVAKNATHYLVIADLNPAWPENFRCRAFAIFEEVFNPTSNHYDRFPVTPWTQLPDGIAFKPDGDTILAQTGITKEKFYCQPAGGEIEAPFFKFNSLGALEVPTDSQFAALRLFEGALSSTGVAVSTNTAKAAREEVLRVSLITGRARRIEPEDHATPAPQES
jgi:type II secretory pathway pseudopilin PulG